VDRTVVEAECAERLRLCAPGAGGLERELDSEVAERPGASVELGLAVVVLGVASEPFVCALGTEVVCV
jgi:hypothetical protein